MLVEVVHQAAPEIERPNELKTKEDEPSALSRLLPGAA